MGKPGAAMFLLRVARVKIRKSFMNSDFSGTSAKKQKGKNRSLKYIIYILIVLVATGISLGLSVAGETNGTPNFFLIVDTFANADFRYILLMIGLVSLSYLIDGLIILVFCRLYTRRYKLHQGVATSLVGQFYSDVTPGASGGQVMQVYTMKSQGVVVSNAASIMVMWFILYQTALIIFDIAAYIVEAPQIMSIKSIDIPMGDTTLNLPMLPLIIAGFALNLSAIMLLFFMSYSHKVHNFILRYVIGFLGKIHIVKKPDEARENLRVQVENFKIELRRLQANIPVVILQVTLFLLLLFCRFCIPYFAGLALNAWTVPEAEGMKAFTPTFNFGKMLDAAFLSAFHQMVTGLLPLPGSAGVSELFYSLLFQTYFSTYPGHVYSTQVNSAGLSELSNLSVWLSSTQILWRTITFHIPLVVSGFTAALYRSRPKEPIHYANRQTFVALQLETMEARKASADTMYETRQMSRRALQQKLAQTTDIFKHKEKDAKKPPVSENPASGKTTLDFNEFDNEPIMPISPSKPAPKREKPVKKAKLKIKKKSKPVKEDDDSWESWEI